MPWDREFDDPVPGGMKTLRDAANYIMMLKALSHGKPGSDDYSARKPAKAYKLSG
jgi:hypothetical protein